MFSPEANGPLDGLMGDTTVGKESLWEPIFLGTDVFLHRLNTSSVNGSVNLFWFIGLNSDSGLLSL